MTAKRRCGALGGVLLAGLMAAVLTSAGCNVLSVPFFLFGPEPKIEATLKKIASDERDVTVRAAVLVSCTGIDSDFAYAERDLANLVVNKLREQCKYNNEKVEVLSPVKVGEYKNRNPNWRASDLTEIGHDLDVDFVIDLEIRKLSLYDLGRQSGLYRGRADVLVTLCDVNNPDEGQEQTDFTFNHPGDTSLGVSITDMPQSEFKKQFYQALATQLAWHFTSHPRIDDWRMKK